MILGADLSHFQQFPNFPQVRASGVDFAVLKASEGTGYTDPSMATNRRNAHAAGLIVGLYHFARAGDPAAEAAYFLRTIGAVQPGEFLVLDWEVPAGNPPAWCQQWLDAVRAATGVAPLIYMNQSAVNGSNWSNVAKTYGLWLARYDNAPGVFNPVPYWGVPAMKQYSDRGAVPGVAGPCDVDSFNGTRDQLLKYGKGSPTPPPTPPPLEADLTPDQAQQLADIHSWLRGGDPTKDNITLLWEMLKGGNPPGENNFYWLDKQNQARADALLAAVNALTTGGVDPATVAKLVLAGLNGTTLSVTQPA
jgi:GH25 family lysozyme M1 (1,4-beta-N-acetylmuramidase)